MSGQLGGTRHLWMVMAVCLAATAFVTSRNQPSAAAELTRGPTTFTSAVFGARITGSTSVTLYVSNQASNGYAEGSDTNSGLSRSEPLRTINEAARRANRNQAGVDTPDGPIGTRIVINDGTYREFIDWRGSRRDFATGQRIGVSLTTIGAQVPVIIEAERPGSVTVSGSDTVRVTDGIEVSYATDATGDDAWAETTINGHLAYSHRWVDELAQPINLGFFPNPFGTSVDYGAVARRREMAFINGQRLRQVLCKNQLEPGTFYVSDDSMEPGYQYPYPLRNNSGRVIDTVPQRPCTEDEADHRIYVVPFGTAASDWQDATFETTFRGARVGTDPFSNPVGRPLEADGNTFLLHMFGKSNVIVRGLNFEHGTPKIAGSSSAVRIENSRDILFEDVTIRNNNWIGVAVYGVNNPNPGQPFTPVTSGITFRRVTSNSNGGHGITATRMRDLIIEDSTFEFNNWRGDQAGLYNWDPGNKLMWIHDLIVRRSRFANNASHGLWLDTDHRNSTVEDSVFVGNRGHGLYLEASTGPLTVRRNTFQNNGRFENYPGVEGYGIFATFTDNVVLDSNEFIGSDIPLVIGGRTEYTHEPVENSINFMTGLSFANTPEDPNGAHWQITNNSFVAEAPTYLITLGIPLENFSKYIPWAAENDWSRFIDTLAAGGNSYSSPRPGGRAFTIQNPRTCERRNGSGACVEWSQNDVFTDYDFDGWKARTTQDGTGSQWVGPIVPDTTTTTTAPPTTAPPTTAPPTTAPPTTAPPTTAPPTTAPPTTVPPGPGPEPSELSNGGFEQAGATAADVDGWSTGSAFDRSTERPRTGTAALRAGPSTGASVAVSPAIAVVPGRTYELSGYIYRESAAGQQYLDLGDVPLDPNLGIDSNRTGDWEFVTQLWTAPAGVSSVRVRAVVDRGSFAQPTGTAWFDDVSFVDMSSVVGLSSLVGNGTFEAAGAQPDAAAGWTASGIYSRSTERVRSGEAALRVGPSTAGGATAGASIRVVPGRTYRLTASIYRTSSTGRHYVDLGDVPGDPNLGSTSDTTNEWEQLSATWTAPAGVSELRVRVVSDGGSAQQPTGIAFFDDIVLQDLSNLVPTGSFEAVGGAPSEPVGWSTTSLFSRSDARAISGVAALRSGPSANPSVTASPPIAVVPGRTYHLSGWIYRTSSSARHYIDLSDAPGDPNIGFGGTSVGQWEFMEQTWTAPLGVSVVRVRVVTDGTSPATPSGEAWFDDIAFREA